MFIDKNEQVVFSVFEFHDLTMIETYLQQNMSEGYRLYYKELVIEADILPKRGGSHYPKTVFYIPATNAGVIIQYANVFDGRFMLSNYISKNIKEPFYLISFSNETSYYKQFLVSLYQDGSIKRIVRAMQDPRWIFNNNGDILSFENIDYYKRKKISDRINKDIIIEYCCKLKLDITNDDFWKSNTSALFYERVR